MTVDLSLFQRLRGETKRAAVGMCQRAARDGARAGRDRARQLAPIGTYYTASGAIQGGRLKREVTVQFDRALPLGAQWEIVSPTPYALYVEEGTAAHWIRPKAAHGFIGALRKGQSRRSKSDYGVGRGAFLRWYGPSGNAHYAREVWHPGTSPHPFMGPGAMQARDTMLATIEHGIARIAARWG